ncbi:TetR family transcriptional regulator [Kitasatospora herbaricolor]|uniref:TetR/AcrR family transcriptional regulator n=1 Tax=Kitasatospora herbaricolor TaxID=68217 RepID=UPI0017482AA6|nr:TetR/AcrR family transcriptional regulator C-terminal domain-containing protein [Kitasatospora herbaricolor]MDQ0311449.1 AcrR family transcriptional regulator [Kitasatospora herbaricolor]GGV22265.1 TetR family transcriptional regulator [Kitasatospora herbaricolor]
MAQQTDAARRAPLSRDRVLRAAVALADATGIEALSMRRLAQELGVVPMALYKHVANKEELLDGMVDAVVGGIHPPDPGADWRAAVRGRVLAAREALRSHPWAAQVIRSRSGPTPALLAHMDAVIGLFRTGGFSVDLTHHVMHALGGRILGFTQEVFDAPPGAVPGAAPDAAPDARAGEQAAAFQQLAQRYPYVTELAGATAHDDDSVVGRGCDDQFEFEFALDLLLDGFERRREQGWTSAPGAPGGPAR